MGNRPQLLSGFSFKGAAAVAADRKARHLNGERNDFAATLIGGALELGQDVFGMDSQRFRALIQHVLNQTETPSTRVGLARRITDDAFYGETASIPFPPQDTGLSTKFTVHCGHGPEGEFKVLIQEHPARNLK